MNTKAVIGISAIIIVIVGGIILLSTANTAPVSSTAQGGGVMQVVAAENFWGSLVSQIGGTHVQVLSIVSDPNADPHEYESNASDARAVAAANYVIENGAGYDSWMDKLLSAGGTSNNSGSSSSQKVLNVANLVGVQ